ncbi:alpha/beta hydrolase family protein [Renibacterium salmoninarum]|nr:alpha/beta fold hydrolase [Renibacterium salmoninarum]
MKAQHAGFVLLLPDGPVDAVILVLHGGKPKSTAGSKPWHLSSLRMRPFSSLLAATGRPYGIAVAQLRYRQRGWNEQLQAQVVDGKWAIKELSAHFVQVPIVLVGHSMGGRAAAYLSQEPQVVGTVALAPWWPQQEGELFRASQHLLVMHGTSDGWTDPSNSAQQVQIAKSNGVDASWRAMPGGHFMLRNPSQWQRITAETAVGWLHPSQHQAAPN